MYLIFPISNTRIRDEAKELIAATEQKSNTTQNDVTEKLGERFQNINYWKFELERGIQGKLTGDFLIKVAPPTNIFYYSVL